MSLSCGFFNSEDGDREYFNQDLSNFLEGLVEDGIYEFIGDKMMVKASTTPDMKVYVSGGRAWFNGTWTENTSDLEVSIDAADQNYDRIDAISLTVNKNSHVANNYIEVIKGSPNSIPEKPSVVDEEKIFRHILAYVTVPVGTNSITQAQIENRIGMGSAKFSYPKWGDIVPFDTQVARWQSGFDFFMSRLIHDFRNDSAGILLVGIENYADYIDPEHVYHDGDYVLDGKTLKIRDEGIWVPTKVADELQSLRNSFDDGVTAVVNACIEGGITPSGTSPLEIVQSVIDAANFGTAKKEYIKAGKTALSDGKLLTGEMQTKTNQNYTGNPGEIVTIPEGYYEGTNNVTANPNQNSGTYTFPANDTGGTKDLGVNNTYRYVNAGNVYSKGRSVGQGTSNSRGIWFKAWEDEDYPNYWPEIDVRFDNGNGTVICIEEAKYSYSGGSVTKTKTFKCSYSGSLQLQ